MLEWVRLANFRSHEAYRLDCKPSTTLILGENGCGKTSVLEAIYIALQGKSFRAVDREIVKRETDFYRIEVEFDSGERTIVTYDGNKRQFLVGDRKAARLPKKYKHPVVLFLPSDLNLVEASPTRKRDFFDRLGAQLNVDYSNSLSRYNKALKQRNELLKRPDADEGALFSWNLLMAKYGVEIRQERTRMVEELNRRLTEAYRSIAENHDTVRMIYDSYTGESSESEYLRLLSLDYERDHLTGHTNFGIHKDDFEFVFNEVGAEGNASRGEMRSIMLALKFIESDLLHETFGERPLVLLDDVFSELDDTRQKALTTNFERNQVILTSVKAPF
ncbi:DNA replication and repair protein RecF [Candidatus Saccharibacteria bacterium]|nr:DNA replication and repair protein RecF [Candidatus Saccharibacteria bacterium]